MFGGVVRAPPSFRHRLEVWPSGAGTRRKYERGKYEWSVEGFHRAPMPPQQDAPCGSNHIRSSQSARATYRGAPRASSAQCAEACRKEIGSFPTRGSLFLASSRARSLRGTSSHLPRCVSCALSSTATPQVCASSMCRRVECVAYPAGASGRTLGRVSRSAGMGMGGSVLGIQCEGPMICKTRHCSRYRYHCLDMAMWRQRGRWCAQCEGATWEVILTLHHRSRRTPPMCARGV